MLRFWVFTVVMKVMNGRGRERETNRDRDRDRGKEIKIRERRKYILLCKYIILMYCIRK